MALFNFQCPKCKKEIKRLFKSESSVQEVKCPDDQTVALRTPKDSFTLTYETIDNGLMPKKVVQIAGSPQMIEEREVIDRAKKKKNEL